jgi:hypothetical protein
MLQGKGRYKNLDDEGGGHGAWRGGRRREYGEEGRGSAVSERFPYKGGGTAMMRERNVALYTTIAHLTSAHEND